MLAVNLSGGGRMQVAPVGRVILALDIEGFGQPGRAEPQLVQLRTRLHGLLDHALAAAEIPPAQVAARMDLGDGALVLFDPSVSAASVLHPLLTALTTRLAADNQTASGPERLRLRVAVHQGYVLADAHGYSGEDLNLAVRLLDAQAVREVLADSPNADAVLVISETIYQGVVRHAYQGLAPSYWRPVKVYAKEIRTRAWVHLPGVDRQSDLPGVLAALPMGPAGLPVPRQLPAPPTVFTGRANLIRQVSRLLDPTRAGRPVIVALHGAGGIGKTALAVQ